jgi:hypothetical protein
VSPFLGVLLVVVFGLYVMHMLYTSLTEFSLQLQPEGVVSVNGALALADGVVPAYGAYVSYTTSLSGDTAREAHSYVSTICFQGEKLVFQAISKPSAKVFLTNPVDPTMMWDGDRALCTASLFYFLPQAGQASLYMLDSVGFEVAPKQ